MEFVICLHCSAQNKSANRCHTARNLQNYRMYGIEQNRSLGGVLSYGRANMRYLLKSEVLDALKESLRDVESLRMVSAIDPEQAKYLKLANHFLASGSLIQVDSRQNQIRRTKKAAERV